MISIVNTEEKAANERRLPEPDLFAVCPYEGPILPFYQGQFDSVFILLHPFIRTTAIDKELFYPETYPKKSEIIAKCKPAKWSEIIQITNFRNISEVDIGLRTGILGLNKEYCNEAFEQEIRSLEARDNVVRPSEGYVPELLQNVLFEAFQRVGHRWVWVGDEFCTERELIWIDDLKKDYDLPAHCNIFTPDKTILLTTHWDSHFSFLCSNRTTIEKLLEAKVFEGFFCDEKTEVYWSLRNEIR